MQAVLVDTIEEGVPTTQEEEGSSSRERRRIRNLTARDAILHPDRLHALESSDAPVSAYHRYSLLRDHFHCRGRNPGMLVVPVSLLTLWGALWHLIFVYADDDDGYLREMISSWGDLINPMWIPISFLLVFRLSRAAVRFWDSRAACGQIVQTCRESISTVAVALDGPQRLAIRSYGKPNSLEPKSKGLHSAHNDILDEYARWLCVVPIATKHFLRSRMDARLRGWGDDKILDELRNELHFLLDDEEVQMLIGANQIVLLVLNRLRALAYDICFVVDLKLHPTATAELYKQTNEHINTLTGRFGALERISGTPLPYIYVAHLRLFLLVYLFLFNMYCNAQYGWASLIVLFAINWAMLGLEAAAVDCEKPFGWSRNHLPLGKFCMVVGENIVQTLDEVKAYSGELCVKSTVA